jgi:membrane-bound metal-dependent hydrolase YbcI (DUF457 family)
MDAFSHAVLGRVVVAAAAGRGSPPRGVGVAAVLGALSPDVDALLMPSGWDVYLSAHQIGTHSIAGAVVTGLASAALVRTLVRGSRYRGLATAALLGASSHLVTDILWGARLRPMWPFVQQDVSVPLVAMADPWGIAILAVGIVALWQSRRDLQRPARIVLLALGVFLAVKTALLATALSRTPVEAEWRHSGRHVIEARWGSLTDWYVFDRTHDALRQWRITARGGTPDLVLFSPVEPETPLVTTSRSLETVRNFLNVHELGFAIQQPLEASQRAVLWSDIRYCWRPPSSHGPLSCFLWFGGVFGADGHLITQQVHVGSWVQNRPAPVASDRR